MRLFREPSYGHLSIEGVEAWIRRNFYADLLAALDTDEPWNAYQIDWCTNRTTGTNEPSYDSSCTRDPHRD